MADMKRMLTRSALQFCVVTAFLGVTAGPAAAGTVYSVFYDSRFGAIDSTTGAFTQIATLPIANASGIGVFQNELFVQNMQGELLTVDPGTGAATVIGNADLSSTSEIFAGGSNGLYEFDSQSDLFSIDPATGVATLIGATGLPANNGGWDTSMSDDGTNLFVTAGGGGAIDDLYEINAATGLATDLGSTGVSGIAGSAIVGNYLDLFQYNAGTNYIYSAPLGSNDFSPGPALSVQIVDGGVVLGAADDFSSAAGTPEPSGLLLVGLGLIGLGLVGRSRFAAKVLSGGN
jgi:hypothetical protein